MKEKAKSEKRPFFSSSWVSAIILTLVFFTSLTFLINVSFDRQTEYYREIYKSPYVMSYECNSYTTERQCSLSDVTINATGHYCNGTLICKNEWVRV